MSYEWVKGRYDGDRAKSVLSHASHGIGYVILQSGKHGATPYCVAAFKRAVGTPMPHHLGLLTIEETKKVEAKAQR